MLFSSTGRLLGGELIVAAPGRAVVRRRRSGTVARRSTWAAGALQVLRILHTDRQRCDVVSRRRAIAGDCLVLPVEISFYTFESMSYVIDIYRGVATPAQELPGLCVLHFLLSRTWWPGRSSAYPDILHQFRDDELGCAPPRLESGQRGIGFLPSAWPRRLLIADPLRGRSTPLWRAWGGRVAGNGGSWAAVLGYTFRIYFDFSGYSDMAVGLGHLFAVRLPQNFNSPYKATDPSDFWSAGTSRFRPGSRLPVHSAGRNRTAIRQET